LARGGSRLVGLSANGFNRWRARVFRPNVQALGLDLAKPYDLRHRFASLLLREAGGLAYVAGQLGHSVAVLADTYAHVIDELREQPNITAEAAIRQAREQRQPMRKV
jgi:integrase